MSDEQKQTEQAKIIVDDDWKSQAQAEKERLSSRVEHKREGAPAGGAAETPSGRRGAGVEPEEIPPASFSVLVNSLATQGILAMGGVEDPRTGHRIVDLELAKHYIDTLKVLEEKTKGNLDEEERKTLDEARYQLRMVFVDISQRIGGPLG